MFDNESMAETTILPVEEPQEVVVDTPPIAEPAPVPHIEPYIDPSVETMTIQPSAQHLRLRNGPSTRSGELGIYPAGTVVEVGDIGKIADGYLWRQVTVRDSKRETGYMAQSNASGTDVYLS